jgi:hypothetical protein
MTELFIEKAKEVHGNTYDYSKVNYQHNLKEVIIICKEHGDFLQLPKTHKRGNGCIKCGINSRTNKRTKSLDNFIIQTKNIHGDKYDYSKVEYYKSRDKIIIICKLHGEFEQTPNSHLQGNGCKKCSTEYISNLHRSNITNFINDAKKIHGDKYDYSKVNYINCKTNIIIICKQHGEFEQIPQGHLSGNGCNKCGRILAIKNKTKTKEEFINKTVEVHGTKFDYSKVNYINISTNIIIICKLHGEFQQTPSKHLQSKTCCPLCVLNNIGKWNNSNSINFITKSIKIHGNIYDYSKVNYKKAIENVIIICKDHGEFKITPNSHLNGSGCSKCYSKYSKQQIQWLECISNLKGIYIQHALNNNEYIIPTTNFKADGYCKETNTIYEFHGDYWHGNPKRFDNNKINKNVKCTFGELYKNTLLREEQIKSLGYNLVVMWESDWNKINKSIKTLQTQFKIKYL